ncbi:uncharacterized protein JCM6883_002416 [Sporobolomyces salmoneus]|uniref:uncharacterized protein n=1 Tax=Sporobolomyces salmoneus TaxID=183962 RepID=UPI0031714137
MPAPRGTNFCAETNRNRLNDEATAALDAFRIAWPDLALSPSAGYCLGPKGEMWDKPCEPECRVRHPQPGRCCAHGMRDLTHVNSSDGKKFGYWKFMCRVCTALYASHRRSVLRLKGIVEGTGRDTGEARVEGVLGDLRRLKTMTALKVKRENQLPPDSASSKFVSNDVTKEKLMSFHLIALSEGQAAGSRFGKILSLAEQANVLRSLDGKAYCYYTCQLLRIGGLSDYDSVSFDRVYPHLPYDHPNQLVVPTSRALNEGRLRDGLEPIPAPWTPSHAWKCFVERQGRDEILGVSVIDTPLVWEMGFDRKSDDLPYKESEVMISMLALNRCKATFRCFKTAERLEAKREERGDATVEDTIKGVMREWVDQICEGFTRTTPEIDQRLKDLKDRSLWTGPDAIVPFIKSLRGTSDDLDSSSDIEDESDYDNDSEEEDEDDEDDDSEEEMEEDEDE